MKDHPEQIIHHNIMNTFDMLLTLLKRVKLSLCLTKHQAMKTYLLLSLSLLHEDVGGVEV